MSEFFLTPELKKYFSAIEQELYHLDVKGVDMLETYRGKCEELCSMAKSLFDAYLQGRVTKDEYFKYTNIILKFRGGRHYSNEELDFAKFLDEQGVNYYVELKGEGLVSDRGKDLRMDFAVVDPYDVTKLVIFYEVDGHPDHEKDPETIRRDEIKNQYFKDRNIPLVRYLWTDLLPEVLTPEVYRGRVELLKKHVDFPDEKRKCGYLGESPIDYFSDSPVAHK